MNTLNKKNQDEIQRIKREYTGFFSYLLHFKRTKRLHQKIDRIPTIFLEAFHPENYLSVNADVKHAIDSGRIKSALEHFVRFGYDEVRRGERRIGSEFPLMSERLYYQCNKEVQQAVKSHLVSSAYEYFLMHGYRDVRIGKKSLSTIPSYIYEVPKMKEKIRQEILTFQHQPLISVIMPVFNVDVKWLKLAIGSLENQWYENWELCIADDASISSELRTFLQQLQHPKIKIVFLKNNLNISGASNAALELASGEYLALLDNDDELTPDALYEVVKAMNKKSMDFIYSDEDKISEDGSYIEPHFKADFAPDTLLSQNYLSHLGVIKKSLVDQVGGWETGVEGAQDYDLYLKVLEHTDRVLHIPKVLYHWRKVPGSTASEFSSKSFAQVAGRKALQHAIERRGLKGKVLDGFYPGTYRVSYEIDDNPLVSIIIPFKDKPELLEMCVQSILDKSTYDNFEIIGISNNSQEQETYQTMERLKRRDSRVIFREYNVPFNYSKINNYAVDQYANGKHILLLNNDIEIITPAWIEAMLEFSQQSRVGAVGAKLNYPDGSIQHAGVILGIGGVAGHSHKYLPQGDTGYFSRPYVIQNISAVTAACLMVKKELYEAMNGLNETELTVAFNDVDFCLRLREAGFVNIYTPYCEAIHYESKSRGAEDSPEKIARFDKETVYMQERYKSLFEQGDPYYNMNLTLSHENFTLREE